MRGFMEARFRYKHAVRIAAGFRGRVPGMPVGGEFCYCGMREKRQAGTAKSICQIVALCGARTFPLPRPRKNLSPFRLEFRYPLKAPCHFNSGL